VIFNAVSHNRSASTNGSARLALALASTVAVAVARDFAVALCL
jgi:hypothetical protein